MLMIENGIKIYADETMGLLDEKVSGHGIFKLLSRPIPRAFSLMFLL